MGLGGTLSNQLLYTKNDNTSMFKTAIDYLVAMTTINIWCNIHSKIEMSRFCSCSTAEITESESDKYDWNIPDDFVMFITESS